MVLDGVEGAFDEILAAFFVDEFNLRTNKVDASGEDSEVGGVGGYKAVGNVGLPHETFVGALVQFVGVDAEAGGGVGLRVGVDKQHLVLHHRQSGTEIDGGGGFAHTAFLIGDRDNLTHASVSI